MAHGDLGHSKAISTVHNAMVGLDGVVVLFLIETRHSSGLSLDGSPRIVASCHILRKVNVLSVLHSFGYVEGAQGVRHLLPVSESLRLTNDHKRCCNGKG